GLRSPGEPAERFGELASEEAGRLEDRLGDRGRFGVEAIATETPRDERVVERPDRAEVVADRVVARLALGEGSHSPPREEARAHEVTDHGLGLRAVDDAAPEQVTDVGGE